MDPHDQLSPSSSRFKRAVKRTFGYLRKDKESTSKSDPLSPSSHTRFTMSSHDPPAKDGLLRHADGGAEGHTNEDQDDLPRHSDDEFDDYERLSLTTVETKRGGPTSLRSRKDSHTSSGQGSDYDLTMSRLWEFQRRSEENRREFYDQVAHDPNFPASLLPRPRTNSEAELGLAAPENAAPKAPKNIRADLEVMLKMEMLLTEIGKKLCNEYRSDPSVGSTIALMEAADEKKEAIAHAVITKLGFENVPPIASPPPSPTTTTRFSRPRWFRRSQNYAPYRAEKTKPPMPAAHPLPALPNAPVDEASIVVYNDAPLVCPKPIRPGSAAARWTNEVIDRTARELRENEERIEAAGPVAIDTSERNEAYARVWEWQMKQVRVVEEEEEEQSRRG